jgi:hypothetical protein
VEAGWSSSTTAKNLLKPNKLSNQQSQLPKKKMSSKSVQLLALLLLVIALASLHQCQANEERCCKCCQGINGPNALCVTAGIGEHPCKDGFALACTANACANNECLIVAKQLVCAVGK